MSSPFERRYHVILSTRCASIHPMPSFPFVTLRQVAMCWWSGRWRCRLKHSNREARALVTASFVMLSRCVFVPLCAYHYHSMVCWRHTDGHFIAVHLSIWSSNKDVGTAARLDVLFVWSSDVWYESNGIIGQDKLQHGVALCRHICHVLHHVLQLVLRR